MAAEELIFALPSPAHPLANPGYGKHDTPDQGPLRRDSFELLDTSAYVHLGTDPEAHRRWKPEIETGAVGICEATRAEILYSALGPGDRDEIDEDLSDMFESVSVPKDIWRWLNTAQYKLTQRGQHGAAGTVDLVLCGTAVHHGLTVLHRDHDIATVARVLKDVQACDVRTERA